MGLKPLPRDRVTLHTLAEAYNGLMEVVYTHLDECTKQTSEFGVALRANTKAVSDLTDSITPIVHTVNTYEGVIKWIKRGIVSIVGAIVIGVISTIASNWWVQSNTPPKAQISSEDKLQLLRDIRQVIQSTPPSNGATP